MKISILIPTYNEKNRIGNSLKLVQKYIESNQSDQIKYEVVVVDDGSLDSTREIVKEFPVKLVGYTQNRGKGYALRYGIEHCEGDYIYLCDADLSTPINEIEKFINKIEDNDIVIGSRTMSGSKVETNLFRKVAGRLSNLIINLTLNLRLSDTQCGFKFLNRKSIEIFKKCTIDRWGYDFELLYLIKQNNLKISEISVNWVHDTDSKVKLKDYFSTLIELFTVVWLHNKLINKYKKFLIYIMIGLLGVIWDFGTFTILNSLLNVNIYVSNIIGMIVGITHNFTLNSIFNFKVNDNLAKRYGAFFTIGIMGVILSTIIIYILHEGLGIQESISKLTSLGIVALVQFYLNSKISFKSNK